MFRRELISGVQSELMVRGIGLALQFVDSLDAEIAVYRRWSADRRVSGVLLCDHQDDDPRVALLQELELATVVVGGPVTAARLLFDLIEGRPPQAVHDHTASLVVRQSTGPAPA